MTKLYYDVGEIGWSMYLAAHIRYLHENRRPAAVATAEAKRVFYRGTASEILPVPFEWKEKFGGFPSDGGHLYNPVTRRRIKDHQILSEPFRKAYPGYDVVTRYGTFPNERTFAPYNHSEEAEEFVRETFQQRKAILIFPRHRGSKFKGRNIPRRYWEIIADALCERFPENTVAAFGSRNGAYTDLSVSRENYMNLVGRNDAVSLDWMTALCNTGFARAAVGNQSGTVKMTLLCGTPTFIFGHEEHRHTVTENWAGTKVGFYRAGPLVKWDRKASLFGYRIKSLTKFIDQVIDFVEQVQPVVKH